MGCKQILQKVNARNYIVLMIFLTTYINYSTRSNFSISLPAMVHLGKKGEVAECIKDVPVDNTTAAAKDDIPYVRDIQIKVNRPYIFLFLNMGKNVQYQSFGDFYGSFIDLISKPIEHRIIILNWMTGTKYHWSQSVQGLLFGAYFYGYLIGSLPAGIIAEWLGPFKTIFWATVWAGILNSICVFVTPLHWGALFTARLIIGITGGLVYPALQCLIGRWSPPQERGKFVSGLMGNTMGTCLTWIIVGAVTQSFKWPWGFHVLTIQIVFFLLISCVFLDDSPESSKWITEDEFNFIKSSQEGKVSRTKAVPPYIKILTSFAFWTLAVLHFGNLWGLYVQITAVPKFMKEFIGFDIRKSGVLSSLPHLLRFFMGIGYGHIGDILKKRKYRRIIILKSFIVLSHLVPGVLMGCMGLAKCSSTPALVLLILSMSINGAAVMTNLSNPTDLSPNFAGTIFGIISFIGGTTGFIVPQITAAIIRSYGNNEKAWGIVFAIGGLVYCGCGIFFMIFGSAEVQSWNEKAADTEEGKSTEQQ